MNDPKWRIVNGAILTALGGMTVAAGHVSGSSVAYLFGGAIIVVGVVEVACGIRSRRR